MKNFDSYSFKSSNLLWSTVWVLNSQFKWSFSIVDNDMSLGYNLKIEVNRIEIRTYLMMDPSLRWRRNQKHWAPIIESCYLGLYSHQGICCWSSSFFYEINIRIRTMFKFEYIRGKAVLFVLLEIIWKCTYIFDLLRFKIF